MKHSVRLLSAVILAGAIVFMGYQMKEGFPKNSSNQNEGISVVGEGKSSISPDTLEINLSISELAKTTELAQKQSNDKLAKVQAIFKTFNIDSKDIKTTNASINPEYDRSKSPQQLSGYRSVQSLHIELRGAGFEQTGADLIAKISQVGGVNIDNTSFTLKDQAKATQTAREIAFKDAQAKAEQLAKLAGVKLGKVTMITDQSIQSIPGPIYTMSKASGIADSAEATPLSAGQTEISMSINVNYEIR